MELSKTLQILFLLVKTKHNTIVSRRVSDRGMMAPSTLSFGMEFGRRPPREGP